jgi:hypothetical protein
VGHASTTSANGRVEARREVTRHIDTYNTTRRHSGCGMRSSIEYERIIVQSDRRGRKGGVKLPPESFQSPEKQPAGPGVPDDDMVS